MVMVGIAPVSDALGRVNKLEVVPLEELKRPRVDVVVNCSGVFRDLFVNQVWGSAVAGRASWSMLDSARAAIETSAAACQMGRAQSEVAALLLRAEPRQFFNNAVLPLYVPFLSGMQLS